MALSQLQCLDDNHVNPRTHESKPEFFYCEDQRLALEVLLRDGRDAFAKYLDTRGLRGFLSDPELEGVFEAVEPYDPGSELFPEGAEDGEPPLSLHYWPELSDTSAPQMDLGWPDSESYRGVTRATVYTQPPLDGHAHVKEIVRKMIAQAQKVIAVVMDVFTDVDIFRDLLDAGFKRKVSVYILLERTTLPHFLSMCQRANMHAGHLKHLRVRCTEGAEFYTRSCTKVKGRMGHRFMFIDGDKAVSGSYSFTWMSSRLDRNLITVVTGQAVDAFDRLFRLLYLTSRSVDLRQIATEPEPEPEPLPQPAALVLPSAAVARKLHNPKYALVAVANPSPSAEQSSPKEPLNPENSKNTDVPATSKRKQKRASKDAVQDVPPLHPGLTNLEKACLIAYLPTWPEPDPPSDVIGFINIRDAKKPTQVHLQRSEMFETSQAIRFSSPISMPKEVLPEVAKPRQITAKREDKSKLQPIQDKTKSGESVIDGVEPARLGAEPGDITRNKEEAPEQKNPASGKKSEPAKDTAVLTTENNLYSDTPTSQDAGPNTTPHDAAHAAPQSSNKASTLTNQVPSCSSDTVTTNSPKPEPLPGPNSKKEVETSLNTQSDVVHETHNLESNSTQSPHLRGPSDPSSNTEQHTQERTGLPLSNSHTQAVLTQPQNSETEMTTNIQAPIINSHISTSSTPEMRPHPLSENTHIPVTISRTTNVGAPLSSIVSSPYIPTIHPPLPSSTASSPLPPPIPKPRTVQLVIRHGGTSDGQNLPEISVVRKTENPASTGPLEVHSEPDVANMVQTPPVKEAETVPQPHNSTAGPQKDTENTGNPDEAPQQKQSVASQETKSKEADGPYDNRAQSDVFITDAPKADSGNIQEIIPKEVDPKSLTSTDCKITLKTQTDQTATKQTKAEAPEKNGTDCETAQMTNERNNDLTQHKTHHPRAQEPQRISHCDINPQGSGSLETVSSLNASTHSPVFNSHISKDGADDSKNSQQENAPHSDDKPNMIKHNTHTNTTSQESQETQKPRGSSHTPERPLRLHLSDTHMRDLRSPTPERELRTLTALIRTSPPDGLPSCTSAPDSQTHTPDPRSCTPDLRTPTPDVSDGYVSPRDDSTLSTTSEEYYECSDSPSHDPGSEYVGYRNHGTTEDRVGFSQTNTPNATTITSTSTSPAYINNSTHATMLGTADRNNSSSETQSLPEPVRVSSSVLEKKVKTGAKVDTVNEENGKEEDEKGRNVAERRTEQDSQGAERKGSEEAKKTADQLRQGRDLTEIVEKHNVPQPQAPKRKKALNKSASESLVDGGATMGKSTTEGTDPKRLSSGGLKPDNVSSEREGERPDKDKVALRPSGVDKRDRAQTTRESDAQKLLHSHHNLSQGQQQQEGGLSFLSQPPKPPQPISATQSLGTRLWGSHQLNQAESKVLHGSFQGLDKTSSHRRPPSRPPSLPVPGAAGSAAGQKPARVSHSQRSLLYQQPLAAEGRVRVGQSQNEHPYVKPQSVQEATRQEERSSPFTITFGRLYSLKGLKDRMNKLPAQSKRGSTSSPLQGHKSTS